MTELYYKIADLILCIKSETDISELLPERLKDFKFPQASGADCIIELEENVPEEAPSGTLLVTSEIVNILEAEDSYIIKPLSSHFVPCVENAKYAEHSVIHLAKGGLSKDFHDLTAVDAEDFDCAIRDAFFFHMQKRGRIAVHSASFLYRGKAWLISASSGIGKSTHVNLWHKLGYPVEDFNGDVTICYMRNGVAVAASSPWCGTSEIYTNKIAPLGGFIFLEQDTENSVKYLPAVESILRTTARCLTPNWNQALANENVETADHIAPLVVNGLLKCRPDAEAVEVLKKFLDEMI